MNPSSIQLTNVVNLSQRVAIFVDGNNIEKSVNEHFGENSMLNFDTFIPKLLGRRFLTRLLYFREGRNISEKLSERLHRIGYGATYPCLKSADIPLTIQAIQLMDKVDAMIILSGDKDFVDLTKYLKSRGVWIEIASVKQTTAKILKEEADYHHIITKEDLFTFETKKPVQKPKRKQEVNRHVQQAVIKEIDHSAVIIDGPPVGDLITYTGPSSVEEVVSALKTTAGLNPVKPETDGHEQNI